MEEFGVEVVGPLPLAHVSEGSESRATELVAQAGEFLGFDLDGEHNMRRYCLNDGVFSLQCASHDDCQAS